ncbi:helix-turn-helix domain-containing protein [Nocardia sp. NPDC057030]|uniref:helix-turn-helix domain-containing protein n=1 Tax=unclassified Nocardia TaxID=2637762 RepID=UPI0036289534
MNDYKTFRQEYDRVARQIDRNVSGHMPSIATFQQWKAGGTHTPRSEFRRQVLETMFPGQTIEELFAPAQPRPDIPGSPPRLTPQQQLGARLKSVRVDGRVSREALARECLIDPSYIRHAESGRAIPRRQFWAEADIALGAEGQLIEAYDQFALQREAPRPTVQVLVHRDPATRPGPPSAPKRPALVSASSARPGIGRDMAWEMDR